MGAAVTYVEIPTWANGPGSPGTGTGNGGWSAGLLAAHLPVTGAIAVDLRRPPPLGRPLRVEHVEDGASLWDDDAAGDPLLVARATPATVAVHVPDAVRAITRETAEAASAAFPFLDEHPFAQCVACGTDRRPGEVALNLHCGPVAGVCAAVDSGSPTPVFADVWHPTIDVADASAPELVAVEACWSALDCPSAAPFADPLAANPSVLARIAVRLDRSVLIDEPYIVAAWRRAVDGRKQTSVSVIVDAAGAVVGTAEALWIEVRPR